MIFATYFFITALAIFLPLYWLARPPLVRLLLLLTFCCVFHTHFAGASGVIPIIVLAVITYAAGRSKRRMFCAFGVTACVLALAVYKYAHFIVQALVGPFNAAACANLDQTVSQILPATPPLALSFFTFEFVHYLLEVRRGGEPIVSVKEFMQFAIFFPSLVAGPIKRYQQFLPALHQGLKSVTTRQVMIGLLLIAFGYFQKVCLADNLSAYIRFQDSNFETIDLGERWFLLATVALRIYFDFNGYSDIAIGLGRMLGVQLPPNFNWPYAATNIRDFWQRWHISLSSWIRDYIYIPMGGGKAGGGRKILNGLIAFALCGLWHGAAWHFVVWGLYHGLGLALCSTYRALPVVRRLAPVFDKSPFLSWLVTVLFVSFGWLIFFYPLERAWIMFCALFGVVAPV